jgi:hypothetical protein
MELLAGLEVTAKAVERHAQAIGADVANCEQAKVNRTVQLELPGILGLRVPVFYIELDGTQVPIVRSELEGRAGRIAGQPAHTREVKLGCVFTQTTTDKKDRPVRDEASTTYTGAWERGWSWAQKKVVLGDGAEWIWNIADQHFVGAVQIGRHMARERNKQRMLYPKFRKQGLFVGSGVIEAGCKTVIRSRLKQSGMFWTVRGANAIVALRCTRLSRKFEDY